MNLDLIFTAVLASALLFGIVKALYRPMIKNLFRLATIPIAFALSLLLQKVGLYKLIGDSIIGALPISLNAGLDSADTNAFINASVLSFISPVFFVLGFIIFLALLRWLVLPLILGGFFKKKGKKGKKNKDKKIKNAHKNGVVGTIVSAVCGAACGFLIFGILLMPMFYTLDFAYSAVSIVEEEQSYDDSNLYRTLKVVDEEFVSPLKNGITMNAYKYTGISALMNKTADGMITIRTELGEEVTVQQTINKIVKNGVSAVVMLQSDNGDDEKFADSVNALVNDPMIVSVLADVVKNEARALNGEIREEESLINSVVDSFGSHYSQVDKDQLVRDIRDVVGVVVYLNEEKMITELIEEGTRSEALEYMTSSREILTETMTLVSDISIFDQLAELLYEEELGVLNEMLGIPETDEEAYDTLIANILLNMNDKSIGYADIALVDKFVVDMASSGKTITSISTEEEKALYKNWKAYENHWKGFQGVFSAAGEDRTYGYVWYIADNGNMYFFDSASYTWNQADTIGEKYATSSPLCQYLTEVMIAVRYDAEGNDIEKEITAEDLKTYLNAYSAMTEPDPTQTKVIASRLTNKTGFVSKAVTLNKLRENTHFEAWDNITKKEDVKHLTDIILNISALSEGLQKADANADQAFIVSFMNEFDVLGEVLDTMGKTYCMKDVPSLLLEGLMQDESIREYLSAGVIYDLNESVNNGDMTYSSFLKTLKGMLKLVVDRIDIKEGK